MTAPTPAPVVLLPLSDDVLDQLAERIAERLPGRAPAGEEPLLLTCSRICKRVGISRATLYRLRQEGLPAVRVGDEHRYELEAVLIFLRARGSGALGQERPGK